MIRLVRDGLLARGDVSSANSEPGKRLLLAQDIHKTAAVAADSALSAAHIADAIEALFELGRLDGIKPADVQHALLHRRESMGGFRAGAYQKLL